MGHEKYKQSVRHGAFHITLIVIVVAEVRKFEWTDHHQTSRSTSFCLSKLQASTSASEEEENSPK